MALELLIKQYFSVIVVSGVTCGSDCIVPRKAKEMISSIGFGQRIEYQELHCCPFPWDLSSWVIEHKGEKPGFSRMKKCMIYPKIFSFRL